MTGRATKYGVRRTKLATPARPRTGGICTVAFLFGARRRPRHCATRSYPLSTFRRTPTLTATPVYAFIWCITRSEAPRCACRSSALRACGTPDRKASSGNSSLPLEYTMRNSTSYRTRSCVMVPVWLFYLSNTKEIRTGSSCTLFRWRYLPWKPRNHRVSSGWSSSRRRCTPVLLLIPRRTTGCGTSCSVCMQVMRHARSKTGIGMQMKKKVCLFIAGDLDVFVQRSHSFERRVCYAKFHAQGYSHERCSRSCVHNHVCFCSAKGGHRSREELWRATGERHKARSRSDGCVWLARCAGGGQAATAGYMGGRWYKGCLVLAASHLTQGTLALPFPLQGLRTTS